MSVKDVSKKAAELEAKLNGKLFLGGALPSAEDVKAFNDLLGAGHIHLYRWAKNVGTYAEGERKAWTAPVKVVAPEVRPAAPLAPAKAVEKKAAPAPAPAAPAAAAAEDDDIDLFGETTEEEQAALDAKKAKDAESKKVKKAAPLAKSSILYDVKAWDDSVDLEALAAKIKAVKRDGLVWGSHKLAPVAFGVMKLQLLVVIEDDKVSGDDLEEIITGFEDEVQSVDIVAWNKI